MTSFAIILGVLPLAIPSGASSGGQNAIGTGVIGGMLSATVLAVFFVPMSLWRCCAGFASGRGLRTRRPPQAFLYRRENRRCAS
jgi:Cu/Ag efflux pump CusA